MERYVIAARLKPGTAAAAEQTLAAGPPFDPAEIGFSRHSAHLTDDSVYLLFEGDAAYAKALQLARQHPAEVTDWQRLVSGMPARVADVPPQARCVYRWPPDTSA
jgi:hypothetical protein